MPVNAGVHTPDISYDYKLYSISLIGTGKWLKGVPDNKITSLKSGFEFRLWEGQFNFAKGTSIEKSI